MPAKKSLRQWRLMLRLMGWFYIPMLAFVRPKLESVDEEHALLSIRLRRRTRNHLKSMYFGSLAVGADVAAGLHVFYYADEMGVKPSFVFKSMKAEFHKRAMDTVFFSSSEGLRVKALMELAKSSGERQQLVVSVAAKTHDGELVASFEMEISVRVHS